MATEPVMVWLAVTEYRNSPRWSEDGFPSMETFVDGVAESADLAKQFALMCSESPVRWFRAKTYAQWIGMHDFATNRHFHLVSSRLVADHTDSQGWPSGRVSDEAAA
jgi:hypothetical protein